MEKQLLEGGVFFLFFLEEREHKGKWGEPKMKWRIKILKKNREREETKEEKRKEGRRRGYLRNLMSIGPSNRI